MKLLLDQTYTDPRRALPAMRVALRDAWPDARPDSQRNLRPDARPDAQPGVQQGAPQDGQLTGGQPTDEQPMDGQPMPPRRIGHYVQLIVHEWVANLARHATFTRSPRICLRVLIHGEAVRCEIADMRNHR